jgi:hypothetical protein
VRRQQLGAAAMQVQIAVMARGLRSRFYELAPMTWKDGLTKMWWGQLTPM